MPADSTRRAVKTRDGLTLASYESAGSGHRHRPVVVCVHGYPDNHSVWDAVAGRLGADYRVVSFDVRGAGESDAPGRRDGYALDRLVGDLRTVIDTVSPHAPVHLLAHDWGSIQAWAFVGHAAHAVRVRSFTSISGPDLAHTRAWFAGARDHPRAAAAQLGRSSYILLFRLPGLVEWLHGSRLVGRLMRRRRRGGPPATPRPRGAREVRNGLQLYRANLLTRRRATTPPLVEVPVQVLAPADDRYVGVDVQTGAPRPFTSSLTTEVIPGGHWVLVTNPDLVADRFDSFARRH